MALGTMTLGTTAGLMPTQALQIIPMSFAGDTAYQTGGTASFTASVQAAVGRAVTVLAVERNGACGGYVPRYDAANDKLMMFITEGSNVSDGPLIEVTDETDMHLTTFNIIAFAY